MKGQGLIALVMKTPTIALCVLLPSIFREFVVKCPFVVVLGFVQIREELQANGINVYPQKEFDEDAEDRLINDKIRVSSQCWVRFLK